MEEGVREVYHWIVELERRWTMERGAREGVIGYGVFVLIS